MEISHIFARAVAIWTAPSTLCDRWAPARAIEILPFLAVEAYFGAHSLVDCLRSDCCAAATARETEIFGCCAFLCILTPILRLTGWKKALPSIDHCCCWHLGCCMFNVHSRRFLWSIFGSHNRENSLNWFRNCQSSHLSCVLSLGWSFSTSVNCPLQLCQMIFTFTSCHWLFGTDRHPSSSSSDAITDDHSSLTAMMCPSLAAAKPPPFVRSVPGEPKKLMPGR